MHLIAICINIYLFLEFLFANGFVLIQWESENINRNLWILYFHDFTSASILLYIKLGFCLIVFLLLIKFNRDLTISNFKFEYLSCISKKIKIIIQVLYYLLND
jgi:hypothetical protein